VTVINLIRFTPKDEKSVLAGTESRVPPGAGFASCMDPMTLV